VDAFAYIDDNVILGDNCHVFPNAVIGCIPQDLKFKGEETWTVIGDNCVLREFVTIHRGTASKGKTVVGSNNLIMAYCHVAHDCILHDNIIMSNCTQLAGEVEVDDFAIIGGGTLVHQFSHIGSHVMIQGGSKINKDIPPYIIAAREPIAYCGINSIGLNRRSFTPEQIHTIQDVYRLIYQGGMNTTQALDHILANLPQSTERDTIVSFIRNSTRGIVKA
jgi:UDP-N-acetylglucosamine acyltransferase